MRTVSVDAAFAPVRCCGGSNAPVRIPHTFTVDDALTQGHLLCKTLPPGKRWIRRVVALVETHKAQ